MDSYKLADLIVEWDDEEFSLCEGRYLERFRYFPKSEELKDKIVFQSRLVPLEKYTHYPMVKENYVYALFEVNGERMLIYHWGNRRFAFAVWPERIKPGQINECWFDPDMKNQPPLDADWFFGISGLHKALMLRGAAVLHASYIDRSGHAILFTAPSGTGKSTQAALWKEVMKTETVNGDRVLVKKIGGKWYACGYPCCGSSRICLNRNLPLRAIVILRQSSENCVSQLTLVQKISSLMTAEEMYPWDAEEMERALELAESIAQAIPVICLSCRPNEDAVRTLNNYLEETDYAFDI